MGSYEVAVTALMDTVTVMLCSENYVTTVFLDITKAFDTVDHWQTILKLSSLKLKDEVFNWIVDFISRRRHYTIYNSQLSLLKDINCGVIQGLVLGPLLFVIAISDLRTIHKYNHCIKYADDTVIFIPQSKSSSIDDELLHIANWAAINNLMINSSKTKAMHFYCQKQVAKLMLPNVESLKNFGPI